MTQINVFRDANRRMTDNRRVKSSLTLASQLVFILNCEEMCALQWHVDSQSSFCRFRGELKETWRFGFTCR